MKGYIYNAPGSISLQEIPLPDCGARDIIVRNLYAGVCGSDITAYTHDGASMRIYPGLEFGHEMVSEVVEVGSEGEGLSVGDRAYPYPLTCKDARTRSSTVGGFSESVHISNFLLHHSLHKIDESISDKCLAMLDAFTVGV